MITQVLAITLALSIALSPLSAVAQTSGKKTWAGKNYLTSCEGVLLDAEGAYERHFLNGVDSPEAMLQLLKDYDVIFSPLFQQAMLLALHDREKELFVNEVDFAANASTKKQLNQHLKLIKKFEAVATSELRVQQLVGELKKHLQVLSAQPQSNEQVGQIQFLRITRLLKALHQRPEAQAYLDSVLANLVRQSLMGTAMLLVTRIEASKNSIVRRFTFHAFYRIIFGATALGMGFVNWKVYGSLGSLEDHLILSFAGGLMSAVVSALAVLPLEDAIEDYGRWAASRFLNRLPSYDPDEFLFLGAGAKSRVKSFFEKVDVATTSILSVEQACATDICELSPAAIAYLGHLDTLELQQMTASMRDSFKEQSIDHHTAALRSLGQALLDNPTSYRKQMELLRALEGFQSDLKSTSAQRQDVINAVNQRVASVANSIEILQQRPYTNRTRLSDEAIAKNELLLAKAQTDLASLKKLQINNKALEKKVAGVNTLLGQVAEILAKIPQSGEGWKRVAEDVLLSVDRMRN